MTSIKVLVCTTSKHKIGAVEDAFQALLKNDKILTVDKFEIIAENGESEINSQPFGNEETLRGAKNRIINAKKRYFANKTEPIDFIVAIENGIILVNENNEERWYDIGWVVIEDKLGKQYASVSQAVLFPTWAVHEAQKIGFKTKTVGEILSEKFPHCEKTDPHSFITKGKISRLQLMSLTIRTTFLTTILEQP